jgi:predicted transcriptional regulator
MLPTFLAYSLDKPLVIDPENARASDAVSGVPFSSMAELSDVLAPRDGSTT